MEPGLLALLTLQCRQVKNDVLASLFFSINNHLYIAMLGDIQFLCSTERAAIAIRDFLAGSVPCSQKISLANIRRCTNLRFALLTHLRRTSMKKAIILGAVLLMMTPAAFAGTRENVGCGLGTMLFGAKADDSILLQVFAATTNGTSGNQTFGVTSGTSECQKPSSFVKNERVNEFVLANLDNLARDVAQGKGETISALAELMEVPAEDRQVFCSTLNNHFSEIFPTSQVDYAHVVDTIIKITS